MPELLLDADSGATPSLGIWQGSDNALEYAIYAYNSRNQMTEADVGNSSTVNTFGVNGYRSSKTEEGVTTTFSYEYDRIIKEVSLDSATGHEMVTYNVYGVNLISRIVGTDKVYYLYNGHGDVTALVNSSGTVIATYYYDAFGNLLEVTGNYDNPYRYAGYYYDERSKLYDLKARFYDPVIARFMQQDTYRGSKEDPLSLNMFAYCTNNPLIYYDPTGHWQESDSKYDYATQQELQRLTEAWYSAGTQAERDKIHADAEYIRGIVTPSDKSGGLTEEQIENVKEQAEAYNNAQSTSSTGGKTSGSTKVPMPTVPTTEPPKVQETNGKDTGQVEAPRNIDTLYLNPTVEEAALMSQYAYQKIDIIREDIDAGKMIGGWTVYDVQTGGNSCQMVIFTRVDKYGNVGYVFATRGTEPEHLGQIVQDVLQFANYSSDLHFARNYAQQFVDGLKERKNTAILTFTGHSKGGAEAAAAAAKVNANAILFDPAPVNEWLPELNEPNLNPYTGKTYLYIAEGEFISTYYPRLEEHYQYAAGIYYLPKYSAVATKPNPNGDGRISTNLDTEGDRHRIQVMINMLEVLHAHPEILRSQNGTWIDGDGAIRDEIAVRRHFLTPTSKTNYSSYFEPLKQASPQSDVQ